MTTNASAGPACYTADQVFFYPKDSTPGCTKEAQTFQADLAKFKKAGAEVIGISSDADHSAFVSENKLSMTLLSDIGGKVRSLMVCIHTYISQEWNASL